MSYTGLLALLEASYAELATAHAEWTDNPVACPNDGEPLRPGPDGEPYCPFDGWRPIGAPTR